MQLRGETCPAASWQSGLRYRGLHRGSTPSRPRVQFFCPALHSGRLGKALCWVGECTWNGRAESSVQEIRAVRGCSRAEFRALNSSLFALHLQLTQLHSHLLLFRASSSKPHSSSSKTHSFAHRQNSLFYCTLFCLNLGWVIYLFILTPKRAVWGCLSVLLHFSITAGVNIMQCRVFHVTAGVKR